MLAQLPCHGINKYIPVWLLHCHVKWHCIGIPIRLCDGGCKCLKAGKWVEVEEGLDTRLGHGFAVVSCISKPGQSADLAAGSCVPQGRDNDLWVVGGFIWLVVVHLGLNRVLGCQIIDLICWLLSRRD